MGCNCGGAKAQRYEYVYTAPDGTTVVKQTEVEARAMVVRQGGGTWEARAK